LNQAGLRSTAVAGVSSTVRLTTPLIQTLTIGRVGLRLRRCGLCIPIVS